MVQYGPQCAGVLVNVRLTPQHIQHQRYVGSRTAKWGLENIGFKPTLAKFEQFDDAPRVVEDEEHSEAIATMLDTRANAAHKKKSHA